MNVRGLLHVVAGLIIPAGFFNVAPHPWNLVLGALAAAVIAVSAFLDQSLSQ